MEWTDDDVQQAQLAKERTPPVNGVVTWDAQLRAIMSKAVELVAARGGTMTAQAIAAEEAAKLRTAMDAARACGWVGSEEQGGPNDFGGWMRRRLERTSEVAALERAARFTWQDRARQAIATCAALRQAGAVLSSDLDKASAKEHALRLELANMRVNEDEPDSPVHVERKAGWLAAVEHIAKALDATTEPACPCLAYSPMGPEVRCPEHDHQPGRQWCAACRSEPATSLQQDPPALGERCAASLCQCIPGSGWKDPGEHDATCPARKAVPKTGDLKETRAAEVADTSTRADYSGELREEHEDGCPAELRRLRAEAERLRGHIAWSETQRGEALLGMQSAVARLAAIRERASDKSRLGRVLVDGRNEVLRPELRQTWESIAWVEQGLAADSAHAVAQWVLEGDAPQDDMCARDQHHLAEHERGGAHPLCAAGTLDPTAGLQGPPSRVTIRYPCSPTCTHADAAKPGHQERVAELSKTMLNSSGVVDSGEAAALPETFKSGLELENDHPEACAAGAEAMRAACWEAVQGCLQIHGYGGDLMRERLKAAIEGVAP